MTQQQDPLASAQIIQVAVEEGQTIIGIAQRNSTTLPIIATLNPQISFFGCDFSQQSREIEFPGEHGQLTLRHLEAEDAAVELQRPVRLMARNAGSAARPMPTDTSGLGRRG